jgi:hypothetical protein
VLYENDDEDELESPTATKVEIPNNHQSSSPPQNLIKANNNTNNHMSASK